MCPSKQKDIRIPSSRADLPTRLLEPKGGAGRASAEQGFHDIAAGDVGVQGYMPPATRAPTGEWTPTSTADAAQWSKHAMQNQAKRRASAAANMQALPKGPSEPFHFAGSGADHGNIDLSGLKFDFGANRRPQASSFMDTVSEATAGMPDHEAEILSSNALQATGHMGAMPPSSFSSNLMGDFLDPIQITVPPVTSSLIPDRDAPQKPQDTPAEIGEKRPAIDDGLPPKVQELDDDPDEPKAPEPGLPEKPIDLEFADPTHLTFPDQPMLESREESAAFPVPSDPTRTLESREASIAAPHPSEPKRVLRPSTKAVSFRVPKRSPRQQQRRAGTAESCPTTGRWANP